MAPEIGPAAELSGGGPGGMVQSSDCSIETGERAGCLPRPLGRAIAVLIKHTPTPTPAGAKPVGPLLLAKLRYFTSRRRLRTTPTVVGNTTQSAMAVTVCGRSANGLLDDSRP